MKQKNRIVREIFSFTKMGQSTSNLAVLGKIIVEAESKLGREQTERPAVVAPVSEGTSS